MSSDSIISRLGSRLASVTSNQRNNPDISTRNIGGSFRTNSPYISGYFHVVFDLPEALFSDDSEVATKWLTSTCESFTPPSIQLNSVEVPGLGQIKSKHYSSRTVSNEFSLTFREYSGLTVLNVLNKWAAFFDPFTGVSPLKGSKFLPTSYKGTAYVIQTKPVGAFANGGVLTQEDVEEAWIFDGCWPSTVPIDILNSDINSSESQTVNCQFNYDGAPFTSSEGAIKVALEAFNALGHTGINETFDEYMTKMKRPLDGVASAG